MLQSIQLALRNMIAQHQTLDVDIDKISNSVSLFTNAGAMFASSLISHAAASDTDPFLTS